METFSMDVMNTNVYIEISNSQRSSWKDEIKQWFLYVNQEWSRFRDDNELAMLNNIPKGEKIVLPAPLYEVLYRANEYYEKTAGLFSPYLKKQMERSGYVKSFPFSKAPGISNAQLHEHVANESNPILFLDASTIVKNTNQEVDLGGIAKGYAMESAAKWLRKTAGAKYGIVDGGGDITMWSDGIKEWKIGIANPFKEGEEIGLITMKNGAIATSNVLYRSWMQAGERKHHLLNGRTGSPIRTDVVQATAVTGHLLDGEVLAKMCFLLPEKEREQWFTDHYPQCRYILLRESDRIKLEKEEITDGVF